MQEQFEEMFKQMGTAASSGADAPRQGASAGKAPADASAAADATFQETIRRTMERMQSSGEQATAAAASGGADDFMSEMLKQLSSGELGADGSDEEFSKMLMGMMEQLTNKEILYEPMKELDEKFPEWLDKHRDSTPADDLKRYEEQKTLVREIVAKFEETSYSDTNAVDREYIVDRMQKVAYTRRPVASQQPLTACRCKPPDHRPRTWSETWPRRRRPWPAATTSAIRSRFPWVRRLVLAYTHTH